jgi:NAD(P)-dependent dehydrogenase (short-subunit alcohol dehydrogenase family)
MNAGSSSDDLSQKTVIVTGAGGHLGRAMVHRLLRDGFRCVLADKHEANLANTLALAGTKASGRGTVVVCDIRLEEDRERLIACAVDQPGALFGLVNNAGTGKLRPLLDESVADWRDTFETNLEAAFFLAQGAIASMRKQHEGRIINIASMHGIVGVNNLGHGARAPETSPGDRGPFRCTAYATSKGGVIQLTRDLAAAVGRWGITVNAISPGQIPHSQSPAKDKEGVTPERTSTGGGSGKAPGLGDTLDAEIIKAFGLQTPLQRVGRVEEIAGPVSFLLSGDATYITGANLVVDGGFTIW